MSLPTRPSSGSRAPCRYNRDGGPPRAPPRTALCACCRSCSRPGLASSQAIPRSRGSARNSSGPAASSGPALGAPPRAQCEAPSPARAGTAAGRTPQISRSAGLRSSPRSGDWTEACWNTAPAIGTRHDLPVGKHLQHQTKPRKARQTFDIAPPKGRFLRRRHPILPTMAGGGTRTQVSMEAPSIRSARRADSRPSAGPGSRGSPPSGGGGNRPIAPSADPGPAEIRHPAKVKKISSQPEPRTSKGFTAAHRLLTHFDRAIRQHGVQVPREPFRGPTDLGRHRGYRPVFHPNLSRTHADSERGLDQRMREPAAGVLSGGQGSGIQQMLPHFRAARAKSSSANSVVDNRVQGLC